nr:hypothetical protein [Tanacetum cinerariifolium]
ADSHRADSAMVVGVGVERVFFLELAFGLGAASPIAHAYGKQSIISNVVPMNSISSRDGRLPGYEVVNDDFCESGHFSEGFQIKNTLLCVNLEAD